MQEPEQYVVEILTVGNELLTGRTPNSNSQWLARQTYFAGGFVRRSTTVRDDVHEISSAMKEALKRGVKLLLVCGGLGPTHDDKTLQGLSDAFHRPLALNREALAMVKGKYEKMLRAGLVQAAKMTPARRKMAMLPESARALNNPVGTAPGVLFSANGSKVICLPGVPAEMKAIFKGSVLENIVRETRGLRPFVMNVKVVGLMESTLAPMIDTVLKRHPTIYVKSHPQGREGGKSRITLEFSASGKDRREIKREMESAIRLLTRKAKSIGALVQPLHTRTRL